jgi:hypothetical protein
LSVSSCGVRCGSELTHVWATDRQHLLSSKFTFLGFRIRKSSSPRFLLVGQALRGVLFWFVCIWFTFYYYYYELLFAKFIYCMFCKVLFFNTIVTACFFQLLLLNRYIKLSGYFGSFLAEYCVHRSTTPFIGSDCRFEGPSLQSGGAEENLRHYTNWFLG